MWRTGIDAVGKRYCLRRNGIGLTSWALLQWSERIDGTVGVQQSCIVKVWPKFTGHPTRASHLNQNHTIRHSANAPHPPPNTRLRLLLQSRQRAAPGLLTLWVPQSSRRWTFPTRRVPDARAYSSEEGGSSSSRIWISSSLKLAETTQSCTHHVHAESHATRRPAIRAAHVAAF